VTGRRLPTALRPLARMPLVASVVVASLAVGIGVNTAVFSWVQAMILRPLPGVPDVGRIHLVEPRTETGSFSGASWLEYRDIRERLGSVPDLLAFRMVPFNVGQSPNVERTYGLLVSDNYFAALQLQPALGRFLRADEGVRPDADPVVVISYDYWQTRMGGDPTVLGRPLRVNDRILTIIGVAPRRFQGTVLMLSFDLFVPATMAPSLLAGSRELEDRSLRGYSLLGRIVPPSTRSQAQGELDRAMRQLAGMYPDTNRTISAEVRTFWEAPHGPQQMLRGALLILQGIMLLLLLAVCINTANLMLSRASTRLREVGVRLALGASRGHIARLVLAENLLLAGVGAALGAAIAVWATDAMRAVPMITAFPIKFQTRIDRVDLGFAMALGVCSGLIFGAAPAWQLSRLDPLEALRSGAAAAGRSLVRNWIVGLQVALALVVLMAAALFVSGFAETRETDPGFRREGVLLASYDLTGRAADPAASREFARRLLDRLRALPSVDSAGIAVAVPLDIHGLSQRSFIVEGRARTDGVVDQAVSNTVTPGYFQTMGIPVLAGVDFAELTDVASPPQVIVNEAFARRFLNDRPLAAAIGRRIQSRSVNYVIAGVVKTSLSDSFSEPPTPALYFSYRDRSQTRGEIHVRTRPGEEPLLAPEIERVVRELDPGLPVYDVRTLSEHVEKNLVLRRIPARIFVLLGPMLLALAAIGIYAVVAYSVSRRTTEIGVRLALGATPRRIVADVVADTMRVVAGGATAAWVVGLLVKLHLIRGPISLLVFVGVPGLLLGVSAVACWVPAHRAASIDPLSALREE
jgi:putative ABC transport system permease protein